MTLTIVETITITKTCEIVLVVNIEVACYTHTCATSTIGFLIMFLIARTARTPN